MNDKFLDNLKKIQAKLQTIYTKVETYFRKYIYEGRESIFKPFFKVAGILLGIVILIKFLSPGLLILVVLFCSGMWIYLDRHSTADNKTEERRDNEERN